MQRKFVRVLGIARSGIHAVSDWIRLSFAEQMGYSCQFDNLCSFERISELAKFLPPAGDKNEAFMWMVEHEDVPLIDLPMLPSKIYTNYDVVDVLIIRNVFNMMASRRHMQSPSFTRRTVQLWKSYAFEALNHTNFTGPNKVVIKYDLWQKQPWVATEGVETRATFAKLLGIEDIGSETTNMSPFSPVSAWQPSTTPGPELKSLERWKSYAENKDFWLVFDKQAYDLNTALFGPDEEILQYLKH